MANGIRKAPHPCTGCGHSSVVHRLNGSCYGSIGCPCGWTKDENGELHVKSTEEYAAGIRHGHSAKAAIFASSSSRKQSKGTKVAVYKRVDLLKIPCHFCGDKAESIDHLVASSKGGTSDRSNLVSACCLCNGMKGNKSYDEFLEFCRKMETAVTSSKSLRRIAVFLTWKEQSKKILAWHEKI